MRDLRELAPIILMFAIIDLIAVIVLALAWGGYIETPKQNTNMGYILPTQTPYIINNTIRVTTTKYIIVQKLITPVPTAKPTLTSTVAPTYTPTPQPTATKVITEYFTNDNPLCSLNIRNKPSLNGVIVGKIPQNTVVQVVGAVEGEMVRGSSLWCEVKANIIYSGKAYVWCKGLKPISKDLLE